MSPAYTGVMSSAETPQLPPALEVNSRLRIPLEEFEFSFAPAQGRAGRM